MKIRIFTQVSHAKTSVLKSLFPADACPEILPLQGAKRSLGKLRDTDIAYLDARELGEPGVRKQAAIFSTNGNPPWGVLDPEGSITDAAGLFFLGAKDYVGPNLFRSGLSSERLRAVRGFAGCGTPEPEPTRRFPGWSRLSEGSEIAARFCYASLGDPSGLREKIGEKRLKGLREDFSEFMGSWASECGGIAWMRDREGTLLLFPERDEGTNPILGAFRLILDRALVGYELFRLEVPLTFRFAFHAGKSQWRRPGSTGTIVSGDVNFIFHLGSKFAPDGRVILSAEMESSIPPAIRDLFLPAGDFEGHRILASRLFKD